MATQSRGHATRHWKRKIERYTRPNRTGEACCARVLATHYRAGHVERARASGCDSLRACDQEGTGHGGGLGAPGAPAAIVRFVDLLGIRLQLPSQPRQTPTPATPPLPATPCRR